MRRLLEPSGDRGPTGPQATFQLAIPEHKAEVDGMAREAQFLRRELVRVKSIAPFRRPVVGEMTAEDLKEFAQWLGRNDG